MYKKVVYALFSLLIFYHLGIFIISSSAAPFLFFNRPESVYTSGCLGKEDVKKNEHTRIFFHYINKTNKNETFLFKSDRGFSGQKTGIGISYDPASAGRDAAYNFFSCQASKKSGNIYSSYKLKPYQVISGIIEGTSVSDNVISCYLGKSRVLVKKAQPIAQISSETNINLNLKNKYVYTLRVGDSSSDNKWLGDFGHTTILHINVSNFQDKNLQVSISPRGGPLYFVYMYNYNTYKTRLLTPYNIYPIINSPIKKTPIEISIIPIGGVSYPIQISSQIIDP